ncbi:MAG: methionyl-tRNA formyltransferase [Oligoflexia bacterium]|nr:methionyl-tRNA formyltransferase [Oligoflexia bacterium]
MDFKANKNKKLNLIFCGTPDFCLPTLDLLINHPNIFLSHIITPTSKPVGRGHKIAPPPVAQFALDNNISLFQTENINKEIEFLNQFQLPDGKNQPDIILVLAFCQFLAKKILDLPAIGCFNIHASILPKLRGAAPIQHAILQGEKSTGITIQKMVKKMDAGDVVQKDIISISEKETGGQLFTRLKFLAALSTNSFIENVLNSSSNSSLNYEKQDEANVTYAPCLQREDGHINFAKDDYITIDRKVRALDPWPGTYCFLNNKRLKIFEVTPITMNINIKAGEVKRDMGGLIVGINPGTPGIKVLRLSRVQLEGKKCCSDVELLNGLREDIILS